MSQRIVFEFRHHPKRAAGRWARVKDIIKGAGGKLLSEPEGDPPYTLTAVLPDEEDAEQFLACLRAAKGVRAADKDEWRMAF
jgi:hypothetical protein